MKLNALIRRQLWAYLFFLGVVLPLLLWAVFDAPLVVVLIWSPLAAFLFDGREAIEVRYVE